MPKLIVKFDEGQLQECVVGTHAVSIGAPPDSAVVLDNPADLKSTHSTFVNDKAIARRTLLEGDPMLIGTHTLSFTLS